MIGKIIKTLFTTGLSEKRILAGDLLLAEQNQNISRAIRLIKKSVGNGTGKDVILDVGSFDGETAKLLSVAFPQCKIMGFEANYNAYVKAVQNCRSNKNISHLNCAISNKNETLKFYVTNNDVSSSLNKINALGIEEPSYREQFGIKKEVEVAARTLDEMGFENDILLLKIDTQGHELKVLEGAKKTLLRTSFVLTEMSNHGMYENGCSYYEVDEWMRKNDFVLADLIVTYRKNGVLVSEFDAIYANHKLMDLLNTKKERPILITYL